MHLKFRTIWNRLTGKPWASTPTGPAPSSFPITRTESGPNPNRRRHSPSRSTPFLQELFDSIAADPKTKVRVDVPNQTVTNLATGRSESFELNAYKKYCLMNALDDIDYLLLQKDKIEAYEQK